MGGGSHPFINVIDKGAVGDGAADDTTACQNAINDAKAAGGGTVIFPAGNTFKCGNLVLDGVHDLTITGGGKINWTGTPTAGANIGFEYRNTVTDLTISDLWLNGDGVLANNHAGIWGFSGASLASIKLVRNTVTNVVLGLSVATDLSGSVNGFLMEGNHLDNIIGTASGQGYGLHHANGSGMPSNGRIVNNFVSRSQRHSIYQGKGSGVVIAGNTISQHRQGQVLGGSFLCAIVVARSFDCVVANNVVHSPSDGAFEIAGAEGFKGGRIVAHGNACYNPQQPAPMFMVGNDVPTSADTTEDVTISDNVFQNAGPANNYVFAVVYSGKRIRFLGNKITCTGNTSTWAAFYFAGFGDTRATSTYNDDILVANNTVSCDGTTGYLIELGRDACKNRCTYEFRHNRARVPTGLILSDGTITNPNIFREESGTDA